MLEWFGYAYSGGITMKARRLPAAFAVFNDITIMLYSS